MAVAVLDLRLRAGYLLLAVVLAHVVLISVQLQSKRGAPLVQSVAFGALAEVQRASSGAVSAVRETWRGWVALHGVVAENDVLKRQLADAAVQLQQERARGARTGVLEQLLDLRESAALDTVAAGIIGASSTAAFRTITIEKGSTSGLRADMAVLAAAGAVGRVVAAGPRASKVQLLIDRNAAAGALDERSRAQGIVIGGGDENLRLEYVPETAEVAVGDRIVTSGIDGIFPPGFVIGQVTIVEKAGGAYRRVVVRPSVDFSSLEEVLVVRTPADARSTTGERAP